MKKKIVAMLIAYLTFVATAQAVEFVIPSKTGGMYARVFNAIEPTFKQQGIELTARTTGANCDIGFDFYNKTTDRVLMVAGTNTSLCEQPADKSNLVGIALGSSSAICSMNQDGRRNGSVADFLNTKTVKTLAIHQAHIPVWTKIFGELGISNQIKIIPYVNSAEVYTAFLSNDIDYAIAFTDWSYKNRDKINCQIYAGNVLPEYATPGSTTLKKLLPKYKDNTFEIFIYVVAKNYTPTEMKTLRVAFNEAKKTKEYQEVVAVKGTFDLGDNLDRQLSILTPAIEQHQKTVRSFRNK
jgi:hypothetical protein